SAREHSKPFGFADVGELSPAVLAGFFFPCGFAGQLESRRTTGLGLRVGELFLGSMMGWRGRPPRGAGISLSSHGDNAAPHKCRLLCHHSMKRRGVS
ncbi:MAG: hypothetical protein ACXWIP_20895, partial [Burkholderiales bacterium]